MAQDFVHRDPFLTKPVPNESHEAGLSIGTGFVENGYLLTKLWTNKVCEINRLDLGLGTAVF